MKNPAVTILLFLLTLLSLHAAPTLEVSEFQQGKFPVLHTFDLGSDQVLKTTIKGVKISVTPKKLDQLNEYAIELDNTGKTNALLRFRLAIDAGSAGGLFWDGLDEHKKIEKSLIPEGNRYNFPLASYQQEGKLAAAGLAPRSVVSRFERSLAEKNGKFSILFDVFMALAPGDRDGFALVAMTLPETTGYAEAVENYYVNYPDFFRPVPGGDIRDYGVGGYFYSNDDSRDYQPEESRRMNFKWEWYYQCYQKAGDFFPDQAHWDDKQGFRSEKSHGSCDVPGTIADYITYNRNRIAAGNRNAAIHYYYIQQYCNSDLLKNVFTDSLWINKKGQGHARTHGWAEEGWAEYAWPGKTSSHGKEVRKDLAKIWETFDVAGFALDMSLGDIPYYGPLAIKEQGKAFDNDGKIYVAEGVAIAYNLDFSRNLPPRADGRRATSITNEPFTYLPVFHGDGTMHEMPPYDRPELIAPRRLLAGQKPFSWWKGFRAESLVDWKNLTPEKRKTALKGIVDFVRMMSFRFGAMPPIFFHKGIADLIEAQPLLEKLNIAGWRAATFASVEGMPPVESPFALDNPVWISRFGNNEESFYALSAPSVAPMTGKLRIKGGKFGAKGAVYAAINGTPTTNVVLPDGDTLVDFKLADHQVLVLRKVGNKEPGNYVETSRPDNGVTFLPAGNWIDKLKIINPPKILSAIAQSPADAVSSGSAEMNLATYYDYYWSRYRYGHYRLWDMGKFWNPALRFPILAPDSEKLADYPVIFALGKTAREKYFGQESLRDTVVCKQVGKQQVIGFFPGSLTEKQLVYAFLAKLDQRYPYYGEITDPWSVGTELYRSVYPAKK